MPSPQTNTLTTREKEVVKLLSDGLTCTEIGMKLILSSHTINSHRKRLLLKLEAKNCAHLVKQAISLGILEIN